MKLEKRSWIHLIISAFIIFLGVYYWQTVAGFMSLFFSALSPIIIGFIMAYVLNILMSFYERHYFTKFSERKFVAKSKRIVCLLSAIITLLAILALLIRLVIPELISCVKLLASVIPPAMERLLSSDFVTKLLPEAALKTLSAINWKDYAAKLLQLVTSGLGGAAETLFTAISKTFKGLSTTFVSIIFAVYLLLGKETLQRQINRLLCCYLPEKAKNKILHVSSVADDSFHRYIAGQCIESLILGILCILGMVIFRFPYAVMIGTLIGFTALIPIAGPYIGASIGAFMILTISPLKALLFLVFIIVLQQFEGNIIYPKVVGKSIGLPAIYVLTAIILGGGLLGIWGMLIGVPVVSVIYRLLREDVLKKETV